MNTHSSTNTYNTHIHTQSQPSSTQHINSYSATVFTGFYRTLYLLLQGPISQCYNITVTIVTPHDIQFETHIYKNNWLYFKLKYQAFLRYILLYNNIYYKYFFKKS